ncbi:MAG: hypothetical protein LAO06_21040, partial [Acidobacteriia bacterium]|nr:hypothetical protein [Terriglobia bacterium]
QGKFCSESGKERACKCRSIYASLSNELKKEQPSAPIIKGRKPLVAFLRADQACRGAGRP